MEQTGELPFPELDLLRLLGSKLPRERERGSGSKRCLLYLQFPPTPPRPPCDTVFRFPSAGYIKISSRTVLFLLPSSSHCHLFQCATVYCSFLQCIRLSALPLLLASYPRKKPSRRANKSCAQSVDINFVSLLFGQNCLQTMHRSNALLLSLFQQGQEKGRKGRVAAVSAVAKIRH